MRTLFYFITIVLLFSCSSDIEPLGEDTDNIETNLENIADTDSVDLVEIESDYDMSSVDPKEAKEFKKSLARIEKEHGAQWDFCTCISKNDSLNKAVMKPGLSDKQLDEVLEAMSVVEEKCQAFLVQNPDRTPEERARHDKKVRDCLRAIH